MTVKRYRSVEELPPPSRRTDPTAGLASACELGRASELFGHRVVGPRGVRKFRSVSEAEEHRQS